jgi:hypothetical protein
LSSGDRYLRFEGKDKLVFRGPNSTLNKREFKLRQAQDGAGVYNLVDSEGCLITTQPNPQNEERDVNYLDNDIASFESIADAKTCQDYCGRQEGCEYYIYSTRYKRCWLKSKKGPRVPTPGYGFIFGPRTDLPPEPVFTCDSEAKGLPVSLDGEPARFTINTNVSTGKKTCMLKVNDTGSVSIDCTPQSSLNMPSTFTLEPV